MLSKPVGPGLDKGRFKELISYKDTNTPAYILLKTV